ncbi:MAG: hypothetical protein NVS3B8_15080 [Chitinophagaceae bacterium]
MKLLLLITALVLSSYFNTSFAQESSPSKIEQSVNTISDRALHIMDNKYTLLDKMIQKQTEKMLRRMQRKEETLQKKLQSIDSVKSKALFANTQSKYQQLLLQLKTPLDKNIHNPLKEYIPGLDSVQTALQFLQHNNINLPVDKLQSLQGLGDKIQKAEGSMQKANEIQQYVKEREQQLKTQLENTGLAKQLLSINKEAFYYRQQLTEYKSLLNDPKKLEEKLLSRVRELPVFQDFMKKHSYLGQLFGLPDDYGSAASIIGLQTKSQVQQLLGQRFGSTVPGAGSNPTQYVQQQIQGAQQQIQQLQNKVSYLGLGNGGSKDIVMPDFRPDKQKTKSFLKRIELGSSFSTSQSTALVPTITDVGITAGYKLNDKSVFGIGGSYKVGLGRGLNHIAISSQGVGFRGFVDLKAKGSIWITGGFEYNYLNSFTSVETLYHLDAWQKSALIGLSKKYKISSKKSGSIQFLYDMLYKQHLPQSQPIIFRMGTDL